MIYREGGFSGGRRSVWFMAMAGTRTRQPFVVTNFDNHSPALSPDGRWAAYASDESGQLEVYVRPFPTGTGRWLISLEGGTEPRWSPTGREIFYRNDNKMMAAAVTSQPTFSVGKRVELFEGTYSSSYNYPQYDVTRDGQSFVMLKPEGGGQDVVLVLNWFAQLRTGRAPTPR